MKQKRKRNAVLLFAALGFCAIAITVWYHNRIAVAASLWHWRYGDFVQLDDFTIPIPQSWLVISHEASTIVFTDSKGSGTIEADVAKPSYISSSYRLQNWESLTRQAFERAGIAAERRALTIGGRDGVCVGGNAAFSANQLISTPDFVTYDCAFIGSLTLRFVGKRSALLAFYGIAQRITTKT